MRVGCVLLASGFGRRFGGNKLLRAAGGVPLYERAFAALPPELFDRAVVTSQYPGILAQAQALGYDTRINTGADEGVAAGIRLGLDGLEGLDGVLFAVCDQPWLTRESVRRLVDDFRAQPEYITALGWAGRKGNPVIFPGDLLGELAALTGDQGGSAVIRRHPERLRLVEAAFPRELEDVDTPEALERPPGRVFPVQNQTPPL